jgi:hypothetical protein
MAISDSKFERDKAYTYAWSLAWMIAHGKTEDQAIASLKRRFKWLSDEMIDISLARARTWVKAADRINAHWKRADLREQQK